MVDYSKWKNIEVSNNVAAVPAPDFLYDFRYFRPQVSDDEDETHPNIDTPSLFRWRHQARVERMEEIKREQQELDIKKKT